jgi:NAD(P)-dependent dehydrogenase (short-subunit alcohol dehydrogenase family)
MGIGQGIARGLLEAGARVVLHGREKEPDGLPADSSYIVQDLTEPDGPERMVAEALRLEPNLDLLVLNAGSYFDAPFPEMTAERWETTMGLNVRAPYFAAQYFARDIIARPRPSAIVTVCSTNGFQSEADSTAYDTSKGALVMLTRSLAHSLAPHGIRVNGIAPGFIRTPLSTPRLTEERVRHLEAKTFLGRLGEPRDCAGAVVFLLSPAADYITGQILTIDGGLTVGQLGRIEGRDRADK